LVHELRNCNVISQSDNSSSTIFNRYRNTSVEYAAHGNVYTYLNDSKTSVTVSFTAPETGSFIMIVGFGSDTPMNNPGYNYTITANTTTHEKIDSSKAVFSINVTNLETISVYIGAGQTNQWVTGIVQLIKQ